MKDGFVSSEPLIIRNTFLVLAVFFFFFIFRMVGLMSSIQHHHDIWKHFTMPRKHGKLKLMISFPMLTVRIVTGPVISLAGPLWRLTSVNQMVCFKLVNKWKRWNFLIQGHTHLLQTDLSEQWVSINIMTQLPEPRNNTLLLITQNDWLSLVKNARLAVFISKFKCFIIPKTSLTCITLKKKSQGET